MKNGYCVHVYVSGGTEEDVEEHIGDFIQYIKDVSIAKYHPEANVKLNRVFKNQSPANMTFVVFGPEIPDISTSSQKAVSLTVEVFHLFE